MNTYYSTVEDVRDALEERATAYDSAQILRALDAAADDVDNTVRLTGRPFRPVYELREFRWPPEQTTAYYRLWLDANRLLSITTMASAGVTIPASDYFLEPNDYGPPYNRVEIDLSGPSAWSAAGTFQRAIQIIGWWCSAPDASVPAGTLAASITNSAATVTVSSGAGIGIGDVLLIDSERLTVTDRSWTGSGQVTTSTNAALASDGAIGVATGSAYTTGESILIDAERMKIVDIAGNTLVCRRAQDGSTLAAHAPGATVYVSRALSVDRGAFGTTAAAHGSAVAVRRHQVPGAVAALSVAVAVSQLLAERSAYAMESGAGSSGQRRRQESLDLLRARVEDLYGHNMRIRVV